MTPRITIGVPTYNRGELLKRALDSALAQSYPALRILVSDNASTDITQSMCEAYAAADPRLVYHRQPVNRGAAANFLGVLTMATTEYFMWLADDDWIDPDYVRRCVEALDADPALMMVAGQVGYFGHRPPAHLGWPVNCTSQYPTLRVFQYYKQVDDNSIYYGVMRHSAAQKLLPIVNCLGADSLFMAGMAYLGNVRTLPDVTLHRGWGDGATTLASMVRALSLPRWQAFIPLTFFLATYTARDIVAGRDVYRDRPARARWLFAAALFCWICAIKPPQQVWVRLRRLMRA